MKQIKNIYYASIASTLLLTSQSYGNLITTEISYGEFIDKITILTIKSERMTNPEKLRNVLIELETLQKTYAKYIGNRSDVLVLQKKLKRTNEVLWDIEDAIRIKERNKEFYDDEFIELARNVYITNDQRYQIKREIDSLLGSRITEEKSYEEFV
ncbi:MAG TPA: DUF6165 family protein [Candidatus Babeliales bacterium]|nr:DUF6165 family protein [Candidatus Babeliales bacterium]